jgi:type II secretory pathway pseudopilin PulG
METVLLVVIVLLGAALVLGLVLFARIVQKLGNEINRLAQRLESLQGEVDRQAQNLAAVRAVLEKRPSDPFVQVLDTLARVRSRGWLATAGWLGVRFFRSYLGGKGRKKALPPGR